MAGTGDSSQYQSEKDKSVRIGKGGNYKDPIGLVTYNSPLLTTVDSPPTRRRSGDSSGHSSREYHDKDSPGHDQTSSMGSRSGSRSDDSGAKSGVSDGSYKRRVGHDYDTSASGYEPRTPDSYLPKTEAHGDYSSAESGYRSRKPKVIALPYKEGYDLPKDTPSTDAAPTDYKSQSAVPPYLRYGEGRSKDRPRLDKSGSFGEFGQSDSSYRPSSGMYAPGEYSTRSLERDQNIDSYKRSGSQGDLSPSPYGSYGYKAGGSPLARTSYSDYGLSSPSRRDRDSLTDVYVTTGYGPTEKIGRREPNMDYSSLSGGRSSSGYSSRSSTLGDSESGYAGSHRMPSETPPSSFVSYAEKYGPSITDSPMSSMKGYDYAGKYGARSDRASSDSPTSSMKGYNRDDGLETPTSRIGYGGTGPNDNSTKHYTGSYLIGPESPTSSAKGYKNDRTGSETPTPSMSGYSTPGLADVRQPSYGNVSSEGVPLSRSSSVMSSSPPSDMSGPDIPPPPCYARRNLDGISLSRGSSVVSDCESLGGASAYSESGYGSRTQTPYGQPPPSSPSYEQTSMPRYKPEQPPGGTGVDYGRQSSKDESGRKPEKIKIEVKHGKRGLDRLHDILEEFDIDSDWKEHRGHLRDLFNRHSILFDDRKGRSMFDDDDWDLLGRRGSDERVRTRYEERRSTSRERELKSERRRKSSSSEREEKVQNKHSGSGLSGSGLSGSGLSNFFDKYRFNFGSFGDYDNSAEEGAERPKNTVQFDNFDDLVDKFRDLKWRKAFDVYDDHDGKQSPKGTYNRQSSGNEKQKSANESNDKSTDDKGEEKQCDCGRS